MLYRRDGKKPQKTKTKNEQKKPQTNPPKKSQTKLKQQNSVDKHCIFTWLFLLSGGVQISKNEI